MNTAAYSTSASAVNASGRVVHALRRSDFETGDPSAPGREDSRGNTRYLCPLPSCADHQNPREHRSLSYNVNTGLWNCKRCGESGQDRDRWEVKARPAYQSPRERQRGKIEKFFAVPTPPPIVQSVTEPSTKWRGRIGTLMPLAASPGGDYLEGRGLPATFCDSAGVRYSADYLGRPNVVFPVRDFGGRLVAAQGRRIDPDPDQKTRSLGPISTGVFSTPGALDGPLVVIVEAPIDALTLALAGLPTVATCGTGNFPDALKKHCAFHWVVTAHDADEPNKEGVRAGDKAGENIKAALALCPTHGVFRFRPEGAKDWNALLVGQGLGAVKAQVAALLALLRIPAAPVDKEESETEEEGRETDAVYNLLDFAPSMPFAPSSCFERSNNEPHEPNSPPACVVSRTHKNTYRRGSLNGIRTMGDLLDAITAEGGTGLSNRNDSSRSDDEDAPEVF